MSFTYTDIIYLGKATPGSGGGGGGDTHNKGYFATPEALRTAYPTAQPGDFAIVESTDTVWVWDSDTSDWKDSDTKGQVTSVNNQTGAVTLTASDVGAATAAQGAKADTAIQSVKTINNQSIVGTGNVEVATIDDNSTSSLTATWSANKLDATVGNIETLLAAI
jgi:hypothetical protein